MVGGSVGVGPVRVSGSTRGCAAPNGCGSGCIALLAGGFALLFLWLLWPILLGFGIATLTTPKEGEPPSNTPGIAFGLGVVVQAIWVIGLIVWWIVAGS